MSYVSDVKAEKKYIGNVVIQIDSTYFSIRQPDSGLSISSPYDKMIGSLTLNPTSVDIKKVTTTISSFSFRLVDKNYLITAMVLGDGSNLIGKAVRIFLGRSGVDMPFSDYFELPTTYIKKIDHPDNTYIFSSTEQTDRMARKIFEDVSALGADILVGTTELTMRDDISNFPTAGFLKIDDEFISYSGKDLINNRFTGVIRGELNSIPAEHKINTDAFLVQTITDNPINIILKILISSGGGGPYDTLQRGLAISESLIDVAEIEALRDELFDGQSYTLSLYKIDSALKYIEAELLAPNSLRFTNSLNSKISLAILDKAKFVEESDVIDESSITKFPKWSIDGYKVTNKITVEWDYSEGLNTYQKRNVYTDQDSIDDRGLQELAFSFRGVKSSLNGQELVDDFGTRLLARLSTPTPEISINTQIDKSLQNIGDKAYLVSTKIPSADGTLNFSSDLEIVSRSINQTTGDVSFKLAFTSFTNIRSAYIAPSDLVVSVVSQSKITIATDRQFQYLTGWQVRLWDDLLNAYASDPVNTISIVGGVSDPSLTFLNNWSTTLIAGRHRIRFCDYDEATNSQKRYGFASNNGSNFLDGKSTYRITY